MKLSKDDYIEHARIVERLYQNRDFQSFQKIIEHDLETLRVKAEDPRMPEPQRLELLWQIWGLRHVLELPEMIREKFRQEEKIAEKRRDEGPQESRAPL